MSSIKKRFSVGWMGGITLGLLCGMTAVLAGSVGGTFTNGQTLDAALMTGIQDAVNDNNTRIGNIINNTQAGALKTEVDKIGGIQTDVSNLKGNLANGTCVVGAGDDTGGMVRVGSLCVDKFEARATFGGCTANGETTCDGVVAASTATGLAATGMSWAQAQRACINAGKRLPTAGEWLAAYTTRASTGLVAPASNQFEFVDTFAQGFGIVDANTSGAALGGFIGPRSTIGDRIQLETNQTYDALLPDVNPFSWRFRCAR